METSNSTILDQDIVVNSISRRKIQPWWMKTFSWIFMIFGVLIPVEFVAAFAFNFNGKLALYGIETMEPLSVVGLILCALFLLKAAVGYGLWFEKGWAIMLGLIDLAIGFVACVCVMFIFPMTGFLGAENMTFRLEILFVGLFLWGLLKVRRRWW